MTSLFETFVSSLFAFVATNVDDLFILMMLLSQRQKFTKRDVYVGQVLGMSALIVLSLSGVIFALIIPLPYIGLLGFFPIYLAIREIFDKDGDDEGSETATVKKSIIPFLSAGIVSVATICIANGGDNVGVYIPLFTSQTTPQLFLMIAIFLLMSVLWVKLSEYMSYHPLIAKALQRYNHIIFPVMLIALGVYIFIECDTIFLLKKLIHLLTNSIQ